MEGLPETQRVCLLQLSLVDRFNGSLVGALLGEDSGAISGDDFLRDLRRCNLFLVPLDDEGIWFRYHHLFRRLLRDRLSRQCSGDQIQAMQARASAWFAGQGLIDEAIDHALQAGNAAGAASLVEDRLYPVLDHEDWRQAELWLGLLPAEVRRRPRLAAAQAWLNWMRYRFAAIAAMIEVAEQGLSSDPATVEGNELTLRAEITVLRAAIAYSRNEAEEVVRLTEAAMPQLGPDTLYAKSQADFFHLVGLHGAGQRAAALEFGYRRLEEAYGQQADSVIVRLLLGLAILHSYRLELAAVQALAHSMQQVAQRRGFVLSLAWSWCFLGWVHYQRNNLEAAHDCFRNLASLAQAAHGRPLVDGYTGLALTTLALGRPEEAQAAIAMLREHLLERGMLAFDTIADSLQQRVVLRVEPAQVLDWVPTDRPSAVVLGSCEEPVLTRVRTLLARSSQEDLKQAADLLAAKGANGSALHSIPLQVEVGALQALVREAQGDHEAALATLEKAVQLAAPSGAIRIFVDCGPATSGLVTKLQPHSAAPGYVQHLVAAFGLPAAAATPRAPGPDATPGPARRPGRVGLLTNREIDVLILLAERLSDKEVAARLVLSLATIRKHTMNIYRKMGVNNRRAAVAQSRHLGLIP